MHLQSVLQAISSRRSSNAIEEGCWCLQYTQPLTSHSPPVSPMVTTTTTTTTKSWRSDTLIILPGWECHTGGSRSKPTVHRCSQSGRRLWVARQVTTTSPMAQPQCSKKQCINVNSWRKWTPRKRNLFERKHPFDRNHFFEENVPFRINLFFVRKTLSKKKKQKKKHLEKKKH